MPYFSDVRTIFIKNLKKFAVFKGRTDPKEHRLFCVFYSVLAGLLVTPAVLVLALFLMMNEGNFNHTAALILIGVIAWSFILTLPLASITVRRLHDINKSGWYFFICYVPGLGLIKMLEWTAQEGDAGDNRFGPNPKAVKEKL
ncbi:MAG: DUF805 domain-containing protein [Spirochaetaceae bacterium]|nr:DUF805 domain-containing protein [Spirochaetaceae bacterium]